MDECLGAWRGALHKVVCQYETELKIPPKSRPRVQKTAIAVAYLMTRDLAYLSDFC